MVKSKKKPASGSEAHANLFSSSSSSTLSKQATRFGWGTCCDGG
jgi:hypothetical protein